MWERGDRPWEWFVEELIDHFEWLKAFDKAYGRDSRYDTPWHMLRRYYDDWLHRRQFYSSTPGWPVREYGEWPTGYTGFWTHRLVPSYVPPASAIPPPRRHH